MLLTRLLVGVLLLTAIGLGVVVLIDRCHAAGRFMEQLGITQRDEQLQTLEGKDHQITAQEAQDQAMIEQLDNQCQQLEHDRSVDELRIKGLNHDEIVAELRRRCQP